MVAATGCATTAHVVRRASESTTTAATVTTTVTVAPTTQVTHSISTTQAPALVIPTTRVPREGGIEPTTTIASGQTVGNVEAEIAQITTQAGIYLTAQQEQSIVAQAIAGNWPFVELQGVILNTYSTQFVTAPTSG